MKGWTEFRGTSLLRAPVRRASGVAIGLAALLACLALLGAVAADRGASGWTAGVARELTIGVRPRVDETGPTAAARAAEAETTVKWTDSAAGDTNALQEFSFTLSGRGKPRDIVKPLVPSGAQVFSVGVGAATAGTFTLTWNGKTTTALAYNATAAAIKAALVALDDGYVAADFTTSGTAPTWSVTVPGGTVTGDGTGLTGGTLSITLNP